MRSLKSKKKTSDYLSIVDADLTVEGTLSSRGKLIIKGSVKGEIKGEAVVISEEGSVHASVDAKSVTIGGVFEGEVTASAELIILSTGRCSGKVVCKDLAVENGGILNADVTCRAPELESDQGKPVLKDVSQAV